MGLQQETTKFQDVKFGSEYVVIYDVRYDNELSGITVRDAVFQGIVTKHKMFTKKDYKIWTEKELIFLEKYLEKEYQDDLRLLLYFIKGVSISVDDTDYVIQALGDIQDVLMLNNYEEESTIINKLIDKLLDDRYENIDWKITDYISFNSIINLETYEREISGYKYSKSYLCMKCKDTKHYAKVIKEGVDFKVKLVESSKKEDTKIRENNN